MLTRHALASSWEGERVVVLGLGASHQTASPPGRPRARGTHVGDEGTLNPEEDDDDDNRHWSV